MIRRIFTIASAISVVICIASIVIWIRSYFDSDALYVTYHSRPYVRHIHRRYRVVTLYGFVTLHIKTGRGFIRIETYDNGASETPIPLATIERGLSVPADLFSVGHRVTSWLGFGYSNIDSAYIFPMWIVTVVFAALPVLREGRVVVRRLRHSTNRCPKCSYDLTGNESGVCPECGSPVLGC